MVRWHDAHVCCADCAVGTFLNDAPEDGAPGHFRSMTQAAISGPAPPPNLSVLRLKIRSNDGDPFTYLALWLAGRPPPLRVFEVGVLWPSSIPGIGLLCSTLGPRLHELDLKLLNHVTPRAYLSSVPRP